MNPLKRLGIALFKTLLDQGDLIATQVLLPPVSGAIQARLLRAVTGSSTPPQGSARLATKRGLVTVTVDGAGVDGAVPGAWAKYAIPKGLPEEEGERRMAIENQPHRVDDFDGVIAEGYGNYNTVVGEIGLLAKPTKNFSIGFHLFNPNRVKNRTLPEETTPTIVRFGLGYSFDGKALVLFETEKDLDQKPVYKGGIEIMALHQLYFRSGYATGYEQLSFGLGYRLKRLITDIAFSKHYLLGFTPHISLSYEF